MNAQEIYQKLIVETAESIINSNMVDFGDLVNQYDLRKMLLEMGERVFQNKWISVNEALPPEDNNSKYTEHSARVFVRLNYNGQISYCNLVYLYDKNKWSMYDGHVTHWMLIPQLKGGEE